MWKYGVLQITLILAAFYFFGYIFGLAFLVAFIYAADFVLDKLGYQILNAGDLFMSFEAPGRNHNIGGYFLIKKIGFEEIKNEIYTKAVVNLRRFRQIQVERLGFKFWMDISAVDCKGQIKKIGRKLKTTQEWVDYTAELLDEYMDYSKPLWEFHILEDYSKDESLVIVKMHHSFTDGVGFVSIMCLMNDEENRFKMPKMFKEATIATKIKRLLMTPYFLYFTYLRNFITLRLSIKSPN